MVFFFLQENVPSERTDGLSERRQALHTNLKNLNVPSERTDGLSDAQLKALQIDLESLTGTRLITDGVIQRILAFLSTTYRNEKILLLSQAESTMLMHDNNGITRMLRYKLVFIPLNSHQLNAYDSDAGVHYSLLVLDNTRHMLHRYDTARPANQEVGKFISGRIKEFNPAFAKNVSQHVHAGQPLSSPSKAALGICDTFLSPRIHMCQHFFPPYSPWIFLFQCLCCRPLACAAGTLTHPCAAAQLCQQLPTHSLLFLQIFF